PYTLSDSLITSPKPNDIEPNDNITQAKRLLLNDSTTGHLGYYYDNHRDTSDWYKVTTTSDGLLEFTFDNTYQYDIKTIILYDTTGSPQLASANVGNGIGSLKFDGLAAGTYYIQLTNNGGNNFGPYTLSDSLVPAWKPNDNEPNDNFSEAETLALNDSTTGHYGYYYYSRRDTSDWYKINITNRGKLKLTLDNTGNADLVTLNLYDASGTNKISSKNVGNGIGQLFSDTLAEGFYYIQLTNNGSNDFGPYSLTDTLYSALPVTFISFNGKINGNEALLNWSTVNEINNKGFEVQKSMNGQTFTDIGFVNGHGNSSQNNSYSYTDPKVISGSNYYRLKQIDNDGKYSYSSIIKVDYSQFDWAILGNPSNNMWVQVQLDKSANVTVQIVSMNGSIIQTINKGNLSAGTYSMPINLSGKSAGLYVVRLIVEGQFYSKKLVK
ncbi:MAG: T9SS type A sorting domain-containing protein, partial [Chitinophagaceae bacterium]